MGSAWLPLSSWLAKWLRGKFAQIHWCMYEHLGRNEQIQWVFPTIFITNSFTWIRSCGLYYCLFVKYSGTQPGGIKLDYNSSLRRFQTTASAAPKKFSRAEQPIYCYLDLECSPNHVFFFFLLILPLVLNTPPAPFLTLLIPLELRSISTWVSAYLVFFPFAMTPYVLFREIFFLVLCFSSCHKYIPFFCFMFLNSKQSWKGLHTVMHFQNNLATLNVNLLSASSTDIASVQLSEL